MDCLKRAERVLEVSKRLVTFLRSKNTQQQCDKVRTQQVLKVFELLNYGKLKQRKRQSPSVLCSKTVLRPVRGK